MWRRRGTPGGHLAGSPAVTCTDGSHGLWTAESRQQILRAAPRVTPGVAAGATGDAEAPRHGRNPRDAVRGPLVTERGRGPTRRAATAARPHAGDSGRRDAVHRRREGRRTGVRRPSRRCSCQERRGPVQPATTSICSCVRDLGVHPHGDGVLAGGLDAAGQLDATTVELRAAGGRDGRGDVGGGDAPEQAATLTGASRDADRETGQLPGHGGRLFLRAHLAGGTRPAQRLDLLLGTAGGLDGQAAGQEVVAAVAALDLDGVAGGTETGDLLREDQLHRRHDQRAVEV